MKKDNNAEKHNLPSENEKKNNGLTEKVKSIVQNASEKRLEKNVVFSEPLTPAERPDETAEQSRKNGNSKACKRERDRSDRDREGRKEREDRRRKRRFGIKANPSSHRLTLTLTSP